MAGPSEAEPDHAALGHSILGNWHHEGRRFIVGGSWRPETPEMNLFQEQAVRDYAAAAAQIPLIDFGPCFAGEPGAIERTAAVVRDACEYIGFFFALNT